MKQSQRLFHITNDVENSHSILLQESCKKPCPGMLVAAGGPMAPHRTRAVFQPGWLYKATFCWKLVKKYL